MTFDQYSELIRRVDTLGAEIAARRAGDLACGKGCTACCHVQLALSPIEAEAVRAALAGLSRQTRAWIRERARSMAAAGELPRDAACVLLEPDGGCAIYASRPLVCRTQGHALRYPAGSLPDEAIFATGGGGEITWCPLNYTAAPPQSEDVLEAERIDELLAVINLSAVSAPQAALARISLVELALE